MTEKIEKKLEEINSKLEEINLKINRITNKFDYLIELLESIGENEGEENEF
jgi:uncharacterized coiled-coil protein SlyX